ncbi:MAG: hypothetical protein IJ157_02790 [Clostridia bacterium]|nr:hypothetical protein [Clostridia bacterium]
MYTYCLFCETAKCRYVASMVESLFPCRAIYPKQIQHTWIAGRMTDIEHDLLPGYIFVYTEAEPLQAARLRAVQGVIRCLCDDEHHYALSGEDERFAMMLLHKDGVIGKTKVYQEGQTIHICKGAFEGVDARILKVNRRNMRMQIEIPFAHRPVRTWVEYEVVDSFSGEDGEDKRIEY